MKAKSDIIEEKEQNVFAKQVDDTVIHISDAKSGRNGYFCLGCNGMMQAKKGEIMIHHFSHEPKDVTRQGKCTYSDETYRHKLAKEVLQRIKQIKLPAVYKFPPKNVDGLANKIKDSETIFASKVENELYFYEDAEGKIQYCRSYEWKEHEDKFLLIKPDVTFFDSEDNPILFIEIVATHKINDEKLSKIKKLGINTVEVTIPKDSAAEIENTFYKTDRTRWRYNNEEAKFEYIRVSTGDTEGISLADELQREIFEESARCRANQIRNFIRTIAKCLGSESYKRSVDRLGEEIQRTERNTAQNRERLRTIQDDLQGEIDRQFEPAKERVREEERTIESDYNSARKRVKEQYSDLERRYTIKRESIEREEKELRELERNFKPECQSEIEGIEIHLEQLGIGSKSLDERIREIRDEEDIIERKFRDNEILIGVEKTGVEREISGILEKTNGVPSRFREQETKLGNEFEERTNEIVRQFEVDRERTIGEFESRNIAGVSKSATRFKEIMVRRELLVSLNEAIIAGKRNRRAKQLFDEKSFKNWS